MLLLLHSFLPDAANTTSPPKEGEKKHEFQMCYSHQPLRSCSIPLQQYTTVSFRYVQKTIRPQNVWSQRVALPLLSLCLCRPSSSAFLHTVRNLHFLSKNSTLISWDFFGWKTRENVVVLDFLAVDNFNFTRKIVKKILGEKLVKMLKFCLNWIFGQNWLFKKCVLQRLNHLPYPTLLCCIFFNDSSSVNDSCNQSV